ncbi:MAG: hypothetical protein KAR51_03485, partial [Candidatus Aenigmarchaeota archaeon]|nr:hypothetical protein [Candidatus Aenigmarchaeota archaeon]
MTVLLLLEKNEIYLNIADENMKIYEYVHRDSFIHRLDPRSKLVWLVVFSALVFMVSDAQSTVFLLVLTLLVA